MEIIKHELLYLRYHYFTSSEFYCVIIRIISISLVQYLPRNSLGDRRGGALRHGLAGMLVRQGNSACCAFCGVFLLQGGSALIG